MKFKGTGLLNNYTSYVEDCYCKTTCRVINFLLIRLEINIAEAAQKIMFNVLWHDCLQTIAKILRVTCATRLILMTNATDLLDNNSMAKALH